MARIAMFLFLIINGVNGAFAQNRYFTKTGTISFTAGTALEDINAVNKSVTSIFDSSTGQIEFAVLIKGFEFKRGLMQEHFNENYLESEKFPKSIFKGKFDNLSKINIRKDGLYPTTVTGILEIHNIMKEVKVSGNIIVENGTISSTAAFNVLLVDYDIEIPGAVKDKISPTVNIKITCTYKTL